MKVKFLNLLILMLATTIAVAQTEPTLSNAEQLITDNSLTGWQVPDTGRWSVNGSIITGDTQGLALEEPEWIYTTGEYDDFVFTVEVRLNGDANSGIYFRSEVITWRNQYEAPSGYEYDLALDSGLNASIGDFFGRGGGFRYRADQTLVNSVFEPDGWNRITIRAEGNYIEYWMNGTKVNELIDTDTERNTSGIIGIQLHNALIMSVDFRNAFIQDLNDEEPVSTTFTPDPTKTYHIDNPHHNLRLAATGESEDAYTTTTTTTGNDVAWQFVDKGNGYWHLQRAAGGTTPRLRTDNTASADMQATTSSGVYTYYEIEATGSGDTYFFTLPDGPIDYKRLQINNSENVNMVSESHNGTWESFTITEIESDINIVHITKRNATGFAIAGNNENTGDQDVYLWESDQNDINQQWIEIDRGNDYYSYQKINTNQCMDGGDGGINNQTIYLSNCDETNNNQQWEKTATDNGAYKIIKRNATGFAINGGNSGANEQDVNLYNSSLSSHNLQWYITTIGTSSKNSQENSKDILNQEFLLYPNPILNTVTIKGAANSTIKIYDLNGKIIFTKNIVQDNETIDLSILPTGLYFTEIDGKQNSRIKLIKN